MKHYHRAIDAVTRHTSIEYLFHNMIAIIHPDLGIGTLYNSYPRVQLLTSSQVEQKDSSSTLLILYSRPVKR